MSAAGDLAAGGIVILGTDTIPGLHGVARLPETARKLAELKGAPPDRPFLLLFPDLESVLGVARPVGDAELRALQAAWPGPLTALLIPREAAPAHWVHEGRQLGARVPAAPALHRLLTELGEPLFSTSANRVGEPPAGTVEEARARFPTLPAYDLGLSSVGRPSTLVDCTVRPARILRPGAAPWPPPAGSGDPGCPDSGLP